MKNDELESWYDMISVVMENKKDSWDNMLKCTISQEELHREFDSGYGGEHGTPFLLWTKNRVYFAICYDGSEWVESVPRKPCDEEIRHFGGG